MALESAAAARSVEDLLVQLASETRDLWIPSRVPTIDGPAIKPTEFLREYVNMNRPVVLGNMGPSGDEAAEVWSKERLVAAVDGFGTGEIAIEVTPDGHGDAIKTTPHGDMFVEPWTAQMTLAAFFERQQASHRGSPAHNDQSQAHPCDESKQGCANSGAATPGIKPAVYYLSHQNSNLSEQMPALMACISEPQFAREAFGSAPDAVNLWLGPSAAVTSLHKDHYENIYLVLRGKKVFTLFPPSDFPFLYERTVRSGKFVPRDRNAGVTGDGQLEFDIVPVPEGEVGWTRPWISVDPGAEVDLEAFPLYRHARPLTVTVNEGEALYLPSLWYHRVSQHGAEDLDGCCLAVNWWYDMQFGPNYTYFKLIEGLARRQTAT